MEFRLYDYQVEALQRIRVGSILCGGVGSGKTLTGLSFYMEHYIRKPLIVITTAMKRDTGDWQDEAELLGIRDRIEKVDSWNNIKKYIDRDDAFFIFDEQRAVNYGPWSKSFITIAKNNPWIMLSATPGDVWMDYVAVFIANGFFKHKTHFCDNHVEWVPRVSYPIVRKYHGEHILEQYRDQILITMKDGRVSRRHVEHVKCSYNREDYRRVLKDRWNIFEDRPCRNANELARTLRKVTSTADHRQFVTLNKIKETPRIIIFYNYNYELKILRELCAHLGRDWWEWNGYKHEELPDIDEWVYLTQYTAGAEGWNCITSNTIIFYSANYSYRLMEQAMGRIDRINTPYSDLYYYILTSSADVDIAVLDTIRRKKKFNEKKFISGKYGLGDEDFGEESIKLRQD